MNWQSTLYLDANYPNKQLNDELQLSRLKQTNKQKRQSIMCTFTTFLMHTVAKAIFTIMMIASHYMVTIANMHGCATHETKASNKKYEGASL